MLTNEVKWMKNNNKLEKIINDGEEELHYSVIGLYEMLAQAQPDLNDQYPHMIDNVGLSSKQSD